MYLVPKKMKDQIRTTAILFNIRTFETIFFKHFTHPNPLGKIFKGGSISTNQPMV